MNKIENIIKNMIDKIEKDSSKYGRFVFDTQYLSCASSDILKAILEALPKEKEARYIDSPDAIDYNNESFLTTKGYNQALNDCQENIKKLFEGKDV